LAARVLEATPKGNVATGTRDAILNAATGTTQWDRLDSSTSVDPSITAPGKMLKAVQCCMDEDQDDEEEEEEEEEEEVVEQVEIEVTEVINLNVNESSR
jgi:hypothetical protein